MTRTEQRSGNPVYVKWEQRQFIPGWSLRLLSPQITDCHEHPANKPVLGGATASGVSLSSPSAPHPAGAGDTQVGENFESRRGPRQLLPIESIRLLMTHIPPEVALVLCASSKPGEPICLFFFSFSFPMLSEDRLLGGIVSTLTPRCRLENRLHLIRLCHGTCL